MQHPLVNPSLAPFGFTFPVQQKRLQFKPADGFGINTERVMARLWDRLHRNDAPGSTPIEIIIHEILPSMATANRLVAGDFEFRGKPYLSRDIAILSSVVQWFATNCGRCFLEDPPIFGLKISHPEREFTEKLAHDMKRRDFVALWTHTCNDQCQEKVPFFGEPCYYMSSTVSERDRAVVSGLMFWLGKKSGRAFITEQHMRISAAHETARQQTFKKMRERDLAA